MAHYKVSSQDKARLIQRFEADGDYLALATHLGINKKTARSIVRRHRFHLHPRSHGGHKPPLITADIGDALLGFVEENPLVSLDAMREFLSSACGLTISSSAISKWLDGKLITLKKVREVPVQRNSTRVKDLRHEYATWMIETGAPDSCIYLDECGFNVWTKRSYGRATKGARCFTVCDGQRGQNISLCMAIGLDGVIHYKILNGPFTKETYTEFMVELSELLAGVQFHFVMDNCSIHKNIQIDNNEHSVHFLPPYSPFLNPIEAAFSAFKAEVKSRWNAPGFHGGYTYPERRAALMAMLSDCLQVITPGKIRAFYRHSSSYLAKCIQKLDIQGD